MKKVLFVANIHKHFLAFHIPYITYLKERGYEVHVAAAGQESIVSEADKQYNISINRNPFSLSNLKAVKDLRKIINEEQYELIHCHTAMGSVVARLAANSRRKKIGCKVIYTAHGFHFFKRSSKLYWLLYFPIEYLLAKKTDSLITINEEDYQLAKKYFRAGSIYKTNGVGINETKFRDVDISRKDFFRTKNGFSKDSFIILYVAEFIPRKNHRFLIESLAEIANLTNIKLLLAGRGRDLEEIKKYAASLGLSNSIDFLGFRKDIGEIIVMADLVVSVSHQEGLPMNVAEALYAGKPVLASNIRGHVDLIQHDFNGYLYQPGNKKDFINYLNKMIQRSGDLSKMSNNAKESAKKFTLKNALMQTAEIYNRYL